MTVLEQTKKIEKRAVDNIAETDIDKKVHDLCYDQVYEISNQNTTKQERTNLLEEVKEKLINSFSDEEIDE